MNKKIGIVGSGSWGVALSIAFSKTQNKITIFFNSRRSLQKINDKRESKHLPNTVIPKNVGFSLNHKEISKCDYIFLVVPSQTLRKNLEILKKNNVRNKNFIICCKGIEKISNKLMSEVVSETFENSKISVLSGPNFAQEVAKSLPTAYVLSSKDRVYLKSLGKTISSPDFRPYFNNDIIGTQVGGIMKNIIAIACGIVMGKKYGENAKSSILTRGLKEMIMLGKAMGAKEETFYGLSGIGDLSLSCNSMNSRNTNLGVKLGQGMRLKEILQEKILSEGLNSCDSICQIASKLKIDVPICYAVKNILDGRSINNIIFKLLSRPNQYEN